MNVKKLIDNVNSLEKYYNNYININIEEIKLLENLKISEEDAIFYTRLKDKRNQASYSTKIKINVDDLDNIIIKVKEIVLKIERIIFKK